MSLQKLFDHKVQVHRATVTRDAYGDTLESWEAGAVPTTNNARPDQNWSGTLQDQGAGEEQAGKRRWYLAKSLDVAERDVLVVTSGPEAPAQLRVLSVTKPTAPRVVHHLEVNVETFTGGLA